MLIDETPASERQETKDELADHLYVVQEMGSRLANETHGESHDEVRKLNVLLHEVHLQLQRIRA